MRSRACGQGRWADARCMRDAGRERRQTTGAIKDGRWERRRGGRGQRARGPTGSTATRSRQGLDDRTSAPRVVANRLDEHTVGSRRCAFAVPQARRSRGAWIVRYRRWHGSPRMRDGALRSRWEWSRRIATSRRPGELIQGDVEMLGRISGSSDHHTEADRRERAARAGSAGPSPSTTRHGWPARESSPTRSTTSRARSSVAQASSSVDTA